MLRHVTRRANERPPFPADASIPGPAAAATEERALADALEAVFRTGQQDFEEVARALERDGVKRPSGATGPWTAAVLEQELATHQRFTGCRLC